MHLTNSLTEYGLISKVLHWLSAILLLVQIPLGFYLVDLDFGEQRINIENIHVNLQRVKKFGSWSKYFFEKFTDE